MQFTGTILKQKGSLEVESSFGHKKKVIGRTLGIFCIYLIFHINGCLAANVPDDFRLRSIQTNLANFYGINTGEIKSVPMENVKSILENPPNIKNCLFTVNRNSKKDGRTLFMLGETNYYRCGYASNGYCFADGAVNPNLDNLSAQGFVTGRFGVTNWTASGSGVMFGDGGVDNDKILGGDRSTMAAIPLRLGVVPLNIGSVRFQENGWFEAKDWNSGTMVKGKLIANTGQNISGVEYETEKYPEAKYVVVFLSDFHQQTNAMDYPIRKWISFALIETNTYLLDMVSIASIEVTHEKLQDKYFHPSFWLTQTSSIPIVSAFIVNHQLMVKNGDKLIPTPKASEDEPRAGLKLRIIQAILLIFATVPLVIWCLKRKQNGKSALDENNKINI